ncbi:MAG: hypothetical protein H0U90_05935 [Actinobacteria bacterium]|nr:hypothetical protein [Actinomycetota bacterium]
MIVTLGGADTIYAHGGDDIVCAGTGADRVYGARLGRTARPGRGRRARRGRRRRLPLGRDRVDGGPDADCCDGGLGTDDATTCETDSGAP